MSDEKTCQAIRPNMTRCAAPATHVVRAEVFGGPGDEYPACDELADQLRQYIDRTTEEMVEHMAASVNGYPGLAERMEGYKSAMEDMQAMQETQAGVVLLRGDP